MSLRIGFMPRSPAFIPKFLFKSVYQLKNKIKMCSVTQPCQSDPRWKGLNWSPHLNWYSSERASQLRKRRVWLIATWTPDSQCILWMLSTIQHQSHLYKQNHHGHMDWLKLHQTKLIPQKIIGIMEYIPSITRWSQLNVTDMKEENLYWSGPKPGTTLFSAAQE